MNPRGFGVNIQKILENHHLDMQENQSNMDVYTDMNWCTPKDHKMKKTQLWFSQLDIVIPPKNQTSQPLAQLFESKPRTL